MEECYIGSKEIIAKKEEYLIPCSYHFYNEAPQIVKGEMQYLYDTTGKKYLDFFAGVSVMNCGHCNPKINRAIIRQMNSLQHTTTIYLTQPIVNLAERLAGVLPADIKRTFFSSTGTEANEGALLLAKLYTGKSEILAAENGLHGRTHLTMSVTGLGMWRTDPNPASGISFIQSPYCYRCPYGATVENCGFECVKDVERKIKRTTSGQVAALIMEPIQGNGGIITPPVGYFKALKEVLDKYGILLIIDEVQTGFARTGKMFAIENYDVKPDIITMAKALGNGVPISAYSTTDKIAQSFTRPSASTLGGNPVSASAGMAVLDYIDQNNLMDRVKILGDKLKQGLLELKDRHDLIGDVRGIGLMIGAEIVKKDKVPATEETDLILEALKNRGIFIGKNGEERNVLAFQPPLVISEDDIEFLLTELDQVLEEIDN